MSAFVATLGYGPWSFVRFTTDETFETMIAADLPLVFHPATTGALWSLVRSRTFYRPKAEFSGFDQGDGLVTPPRFRQRDRDLVAA